MVEHAWFFLAMVGPFLYALTNHIDKTLLEKHFKEDGVMVLLIYSAVLALMLVPVAYFMDTTVLSVSYHHMLVLAGVAVLDVVMLWAYLMAMEDDEPTVVIVYYQLVPVLALLFGYVVLDEVISSHQFFAMVVVIAGASLMSFRMIEGEFVFKKRTAGYMLLGCSLWALEGVIFKKVALEENVWRSAFWEHLALGVLGFGIFLIPKYRKSFLKQYREKSKAVLGFSALNEALYMTGNVAVAFASLLAPVALVMLANAYQPIFVMGIGILLAIFLPKFATEKIDRGHILQKLVAIVISGAGTYMLLSSGVEV